VEHSPLVLLLLCIHLRHRGTRPGASSRRQGRCCARGSASPCSSRPQVHPLEDGLRGSHAPGRRSAELLAGWDGRRPRVVAGGGGPGRAEGAEEGPTRPRAHAAPPPLLAMDGRWPRPPLGAGARAHRPPAGGISGAGSSPGRAARSSPVAPAPVAVLRRGARAPARRWGGVGGGSHAARSSPAAPASVAVLRGGARAPGRCAPLGRGGQREQRG
jgi:hypothetical protein